MRAVMEHLEKLIQYLPADFEVNVKAFVVGVILLVLICLYLLGGQLSLRRIFSFQTECWFCSERVPVSIFQRNSFTCPFCEQYNGFTEDGDYNKPMPAMYSRQLNQRKIHTEVVGHPNFTHNFFCEQCLANQASKVQQLAAFVPLNEANFETEFRDFERQLEDIFQLCPPCLLRANQEIERQDLILYPTLQAHRLRENKRKKKQWTYPRMLGFILVITAVRLATIFATYCLFARDRLVRNGKLDDQNLWMKSVDRQQSSVALAALSLFILSTLLSGRERLKKIDGLLLISLSLLFLVSQPIEGAFSIFSQQMLENKNFCYLVSAVSLLTSIYWTASHFLNLIRFNRTKSHPTNQFVEDEDSIDGSYVSDASSSGNEQEDEEITQDSVQPGETADMYDPIPPNEAAPCTSQDAGGPSDARGRVRDSMGSLTLGPPGDVPKKRNDLWTSRIDSNHTPPLSEMVGSRPVVHPARFNYAGGSLSGSAASSVVDGPTVSSSTNSVTQAALRAQSNLRGQYASRAHQVSQRKKKQNEEDEESTSGIDGSSDEISSSASGSRRRRRRRHETRGRNKRPESNTGFSQITSLLVAILLGISLGLNISAGLYFYSSK